MASDQFIKLPKLFLIAGGFWPFKITENPFYAKCYKFYSRFQTISYIFFILSLVINLCILVVNHNQPTRLYSSVNVLIIVLESCVKILLYQIKKIPDMCSHIMSHEEMLLESKENEEKECYERQMSYCKKINAWIMMTTILSCASFALVNTLKVFYSGDLVSDYKDQPFMHDMWYPFRREHHMKVVILLNMPGFAPPQICLQQFNAFFSKTTVLDLAGSETRLLNSFIADFAVAQGLCFNTATQTTFVTLMTYASGRLKILQIRLRKFDKIAQQKHEGDILLAVKELIVEHQMLIRFVESLNERTNFVMLLEFVLNAVSLASGTIQLVVIKTLSGLLSICSIIIMQLSQIFILGWSSNEIGVQSVGIADAISASSWHEQSQEVQKLFILMILRSQKPLGIFGGPFFRMTTNTALATVKIAYSYLSFMMQNVED